MSGVILSFETPAQKEERLYREAMAAFSDFSAAQPRASLDGVRQALERLVAFQDAARARAAKTDRPASHGMKRRLD